MNYFSLIDEIQDKIDKAYDDCNFDAISYLEELLDYVRRNWND
jgi:hypothetical protein